MDRRSYLALVSIGASGVAGCLGAPTASADAEETASAVDAVPRSRSLPGRDDVELPVPRSELTRAASMDVFPAITDTAIGSDWAGIELADYSGAAARPRLAAADRVIGVDRNGVARAYPLRLLAAHEIVNDNFGGPLLVSYCPLCGSGVVAQRQLGGEPTTFGVSGRLWQSDLVMYDEQTGSLWSQLLALAIRGARTGTRLGLIPSTLTTWGQWRDTHPDTGVVRPPPESTTIDGSGPQYYGTERYDVYKESEQIGGGRPGEASDDDRLHPKTEVIGVIDGETARAYPLPAVRTAGVINDTVGDLPVVVAATDTTVVAYERRLTDRSLRFERRDQTHLSAGGSRWAILSGRAVDGPFEGTRLETATARSQLFWFAWQDFYPETERYRG